MSLNEDGSLKLERYEPKWNTDLLATADRMKNDVREEKYGYRNISPAGHTMCNVIAGFLVGLYQFAETLPTKERELLYNIVHKGEQIPQSIVDICTPKPDDEDA